MSEIAVPSHPAVVPRSRASHTFTLAAVFVMSFASLLLELSLTRVFSVILYYHFAFLVVSIALLGLGAGGVFAYVWKERLSRWGIQTLGWTTSAVNSTVIVLVLVFVLRIPVSMQLSLHNLYRLTAVYLLSAVPFFLTGLLFSVVFARDTPRIGQLYGADLVGGAIACLAIVALLNSVGGPNTVLASAVGMAVAAALWAGTGKQRSLAALLIVALAVLLAANHAGGLIDIVYAKGLREAYVFARWNAISRVTVDQRSDYKWITIDSSANTPLMNLPPHAWKGTSAEASLMSQPAAAVNVLRPHGEFAIIGPGGGIDVLRAVGSGSARVTGIEINPLIATTLMRGKYADESHHLYEVPEVRIRVSDGRSWLRGSTEKFDVVQMTGVDTWAATVAGALALSENNLYTVEAFREYFDHLNPDGILAITRWELERPQEALRIVSVAMEALHQSGIRETAHNFILVSDRPLYSHDNQAASVLVMAKKSSFTAEEEASVRAHVLKYPPLHRYRVRTEHRTGLCRRCISGRCPGDFHFLWPFRSGTSSLEAQSRTSPSSAPATT